MASGGYYSPYYQPAPYYYNYSHQQQQQQRARGGGGGGAAGQSMAHVFLLLAMVSLLAATTMYAWCESAVESMLDQLRLFLILSPLLVILAVQLCVPNGGERRVGGGGHMSLLAELVTGHQREQYRYGGGGGADAGSSPWGVALALALVLILVSYQSSFGEVVPAAWPAIAALIVAYLTVMVAC